MDHHTVNTSNWSASGKRLGCFAVRQHLLHDFLEMVRQQKYKVVCALQICSQTEFLQQSPAWWSPGPVSSHNNHPGDLLVLWVHTTITLVISWSCEFTQQSPWWSPGPVSSHNNHPGDLLVLWVHTTITLVISHGPSGSHNNHLPGDLLVRRVHTTITCLVISWSFGFTHQSPVWWSPGPLGSHKNHLPGDLLVLWVQQQSPAWWSPGPLGSTTITRLVISWSFGFNNSHLPGDLLVLWVQQQSPAWWSPGPLGSTTITRLVISWSFGFNNSHPPGDHLVLWVQQQSPAWWSPGPLGSHNNHPSGGLLVLWVHTTITSLVISWSFGFTQQSPAWWSLGPSGSHKMKSHDCSFDTRSRLIFASRSNTKPGVTYVTKHMWQSSVPSSYQVQISDPRLEVFPIISSLKAMLPSCMVSSSLVLYWSVQWLAQIVYLLNYPRVGQKFKCSDRMVVICCFKIVI